MDTSGPTETKKPKQEEPKEEPMPQEDSQAKLDAKKLKDEGNAFYKKKQFDQAIEKYDAVRSFLYNFKRGCRCLLLKLRNHLERSETLDLTNITVLLPYREQNLMPKMPKCSLYGRSAPLGNKDFLKSRKIPSYYIKGPKPPICIIVIVFSSLFLVSNHL